MYGLECVVCGAFTKVQISGKATDIDKQNNRKWNATVEVYMYTLIWPLFLGQILTWDLFWTRLDLNLLPHVLFSKLLAQTCWSSGWVIFQRNVFKLCKFLTVGIFVASQTSVNSKYHKWELVKEDDKHLLIFTPKIVEYIWYKKVKVFSILWCAVAVAVTCYCYEYASH